MSVQLYAFTCGTVTGEFACLMEGGEGDITMPVPVFLIEHPKGRALFDTGLHPIAGVIRRVASAQRREWDAGMDPDTAARHGYDPRDFDLGHKLRLVDGEHDMFAMARFSADPRPHTGASVAARPARHRRCRARCRRLLFLPNLARAAPAPLRAQP